MTNDEQALDLRADGDGAAQLDDLWKAQHGAKRAGEVFGHKSGHVCKCGGTCDDCKTHATENAMPFPPQQAGAAPAAPATPAAVPPPHAKPMTPGQFAGGTPSPQVVKPQVAMPTPDPQASLKAAIKSQVKEQGRAAAGMDSSDSGTGADEEKPEGEKSSGSKEARNSDRYVNLVNSLRDIFGLTNNAPFGVGQPRHGDTGQYLPHGSGFGKGGVYKGAVDGFHDGNGLQGDAEDIEGGKQHVSTAYKGADHAGAELVGKQVDRAEHVLTRTKPVDSDSLVESDEPDDHTKEAILEGDEDTRTDGAGGKKVVKDQQHKKTINFWSDEARAASAAARAGSGKAGGYAGSVAQGHADNAVASAKAGEHGEAADYHEAAASAHKDAADRLYAGGKNSEAEAHDKAAALHTKAAGIHKAKIAENTLWLAYNRDWPQEKRDKLDTKDFAGPHQSFPITKQEDVDSAVHLTGHADDPEAVKRKIKRIARRKGLKLPDSMEDNCETTMSKNSNPEGINQYSHGGGGVKKDWSNGQEMTLEDVRGGPKEKAEDATKRAEEFSKKANKSNDYMLHREAAQAHLLAAREHGIAESGLGQPESKAAVSHTEKALEHQQKARDLRNRVSNSSVSRSRKENSMTLSRQQREAALKKLTANMSRHEDVEVFNELSDDALINVLTANAPNYSGLSADKKTAKAQDDEDDVYEGESDYSGGGQKGKENPIDAGKTRLSGEHTSNRRQSLEEWMSSAPPEVQTWVRNAQRIDKQARKQLIDRLNVLAADESNTARQQLIVNKLQQKPALSFDQLQELLILVQPTVNRSASEFGTPPALYGAPIPVENTQPIEDRGDVLELPAMNYAPLPEEEQRQQRA